MKYIFAVLVLALGFCSEVHAETETSTLRSSVSVESILSQKGYGEIYSENSYYADYDFVTDTRVRYYHPLFRFFDMNLSTYIGANIQAQSDGAKSQYYDNTASPHMGLNLKIYPGVSLQAQVGYRTTITKDNEFTSAQWDPRSILSAGNIFFWTNPAVFTEFYGEASYVPRLSSTPVSVVWMKQGYRWKPFHQFVFDAYAELYGRESRNDDLGPTRREGRLGARSMYLPGAWNFSLLAFHPISRDTGHGDLDGLFVVGGTF